MYSHSFDRTQGQFYLYTTNDKHLLVLRKDAYQIKKRVSFISLISGILICERTRQVYYLNSEAYASEFEDDKDIMFIMIVCVFQRCSIDFTALSCNYNIIIVCNISSASFQSQPNLKANAYEVMLVSFLCFHHFHICFCLFYIFVYFKQRSDLFFSLKICIFYILRIKPRQTSYI